MPDKHQLNIHIDTDLYHKAKEKQAPFSQIMNEALKVWIANNLTVEEQQKIEELSRVNANDMRLQVEASKITSTTLSSDYYIKITEDGLKERGFTDKEIYIIFELAKKQNTNISNQTGEGYPV